MNKSDFRIDDTIVLHLVKDAGSATETTYTCTKTLTSTDLLVTDKTSYGGKTKVYAAKVPFTAFTAE